MLFMNWKIIVKWIDFFHLKFFYLNWFFLANFVINTITMMNIVEAKIIIIKLFVRSVIAFGIFAWIVEEILVVVIGFVWDIIACFVDWLDLVEDWLSLVVNCLIGVMVLVWFFETYLPLVLVVIVDLLFDVAYIV